MAVEFSLQKEMVQALKIASKIPQKRSTFQNAVEGFDTGGFLVGDGHNISFFVMTGHQFVKAKIGEYKGDKFETFMPAKTMREIGGAVKKKTPEWISFQLLGNFGLKCSHIPDTTLEVREQAHPDDGMFDHYVDEMEAYGVNEYDGDGIVNLLGMFKDALKVDETKYGKIFTWRYGDGKCGHVNCDYLENLVKFMTAVDKTPRLKIECFASAKWNYNGQGRVFRLQVGGAWAILMAVTL